MLKFELVFILFSVIGIFSNPNVFILVIAVLSMLVIGCVILYFRVEKAIKHKFSTNLEKQPLNHFI